jgi:hypothetical protein
VSTPDRVDGEFRVYRVFEAVPQVNLLDVDARRLYSVYRSGYPDAVQSVVDGLSTGDLVSATVEGDPDDATEPWRVVAAERDPSRSVAVETATGVDYPAVAREAWARAREEADGGPVAPTGRVLRHDGAVAGEVWVQPRDALPEGAFTRRLLAGLLPVEPLVRDLPRAGAPAAELLALDADGPGVRDHREPYGVLLFLTDAGRPLADRYRERWGLARGADSRPDFDPY